MRYIFTLLLIVHGAIHLMGFTKAFELADIDQLKNEISRFAGLFWLAAFLLFIISGLAFIAKADWWYIIAFIGIFLSTILIISTWHDAKFGTIANIFILVMAIQGYGASSFYRSYHADVSEALSKSGAMSDTILTEADIDHLPNAVKKYLRLSGAVGKPIVKNFRVECNGKIRQDEQSEWMPFTTAQYNFIDDTERLFFMKAKMKKLPVTGYHSFKNGKATMDIRLLSLFKVQYQSGNEMDISETVTFFNDMCCLAPATLIDKRIRWVEADSSSAKAEFTNRDIIISARLIFNARGELVNFISDDRYAAGKNNSMTRLPWSTPLDGYKEINGSILPGNAELIYNYPHGEFCYGVFNITGIEYNCQSFRKD